MNFVFQHPGDGELLLFPLSHPAESISVTRVLLGSPGFSRVLLVSPDVIYPLFYFSLTRRGAPAKGSPGRTFMFSLKEGDATKPRKTIEKTRNVSGDNSQNSETGPADLISTWLLHVQEQRDHVQEQRDHVQEQRGHVQEQRDHVQEQRDHVQEQRGHDQEQLSEAETSQVAGSETE
ncbi:hypothetical protein EYF80_029855 [Liparis tanakae]|uniref:Uncharacterized protein n=1 Tax=Liparis tanakae TaxID=230148 RepID=A0A4Z2H292_9TELE|nr:hypothetical protein EYF80_029855 [Liparis tanakae]